MIESFNVRPDDAGKSLADFLSEQLRLTRSAVERLIRAGQVRVARTVCVEPRECLRASQSIVVQLVPVERSSSTTKESRDIAHRPVIVHADPHLVVVNK